MHCVDSKRNGGEAREAREEQEQTHLRTFVISSVNAKCKINISHLLWDFPAAHCCYVLKYFLHPACFSVTPSTGCVSLSAELLQDSTQDPQFSGTCWTRRTGRLSSAARAQIHFNPVNTNNNRSNTMSIYI